MPEPRDPSEGFALGELVFAPWLESEVAYTADGAT